MSDVRQSLHGYAAFGRRWGLAVAVGAAVGLAYTVVAMPALGDRLGDIAGGALSSVAGIGLGLLAAVFVAALGRMARPGATAAGPLDGGTCE